MIALWLMLALLAFLLYGFQATAQKAALNELSAPNMILLSMILTVPLFLICLVPFIVNGSIWSIQPLNIVFALIAASFYQLGYYVYLEASERGPISIVASVSDAYPIIVIAFAILVLGEMKEVTVIQLAGALLIVASIVALSFFHGREQGKILPGRRYYLLCLVTVFLWGICGIFQKLALDLIDPLLFIGIYAFIIPPVTLGYFRFKNIKVRDAVPKWSRPLRIAIASVILGSIAIFADMFAVSQGPASIVFPLVASSPLIVVLLAYGFLKERLTRREWLMVATVILGIILVSTV